MSTVTTMHVAGLVVGEHEIRPPGQDDWLPVTDVKQQIDPSSGTPTGTVFLYAGERVFLTTLSTRWPVREIA